MPEYIILSHRHEGCVRLTVEPSGGVVLHDFNIGTPARVQLDRGEVSRMLQALPRELLHTALEGQPEANPFLALDDPLARCNACRILAAIKQYSDELYRVPEPSKGEED